LANWDVFHADRLELERGVSTEAIRAGLASGDLRDDDLIRPAGTTVAWERLIDLPELMVPLAAPAQPSPIGPPSAQSAKVQPPAAPNLPSGTATTRPSHRQPTPGQQRGPESGTSDFEVVAKEEVVAEREAPGATQAPTIAVPDWFNLRSEADDVAFPFITGAPAESGFEDRGPSTPAVPPEPAWSWEEDDRDEDADEGEDEDAAEDGPEVQGEAEYTAELVDGDELEIIDGDEAGPPLSTRSAADESSTSRVALEVAATPERVDIWADEAADLEDEGSFSLSRSGPVTVEELDLAPMVDVAFQLVLFFMVTATTILYKTLEIPKPSTDAPSSGVTQGRSRSLDDFQNDYILVEIDSSGMMKIDREPVAANMATLVERLRTAREKTGRKSILLSAEHSTRHRAAVLAYDAANEIALGIVIARPQAPQGPAPALAPAAPPANADVGKAQDSRPPPN